MRRNPLMKIEITISSNAQRNARKPALEIPGRTKGSVTRQRL